MPYDVEAIRKKIKQSMAGKFSDPDEFRPEKAKSATEPVKYRFFVLPPLVEGDVLKSGKVARGMDSQFFVAHGNHWVNDKPYPCPRLAQTDRCPICDFGFDLLKDESVKNNDAKRQAILKQWMPTQYFMMNIFFANFKENPEDLRSRVMFYNAPKTVIDVCTACLMRDDAGDPESPEAFGVFYDENAAFPFELQVLKQGRNNSYKTSKFLATPRSIVRNNDGSMNPAGIAAALAARHNLHQKIEMPDMAKIQRVFEVMQNGDDSGFDGKAGFDADETTAASPHAGKFDPNSGKSGVAAVPAKKVAVAPKPVAKKPLGEEEDVATLVETAAVKKPAVSPTKKAVPASVEPLADEMPIESDEGSGDGVDKDEIDNLLGQLDDDD